MYNFPTVFEYLKKRPVNCILHSMTNELMLRIPDRVIKCRSLFGAVH